MNQSGIMINRSNVLLKNETIHETRLFLESKGFIEVFPSRIGNISAACEDAKTLFSIDYYGQKAYLSQTAQPYLEEYAQVFEKVYCFTPCFRKETEADHRHLSEFWHIEVEWITDSLKDVEEFVEAYLEMLVQKVFTRRTIEIPFERVEYTDASSIISAPRFVQHFPEEQKWFNFKRSEKGGTTESADLEVPDVGEVIGMGIRCGDYIELEQRLDDQLQKANLTGHKKDFTDYLQMKKTHSTCTGGFGAGLERLMMYLGGISRIQDTGDSARYIRDYSTKI